MDEKKHKSNKKRQNPNSRARTYGLPSPLIHNQYGDFIQGVINTDWLAQDKVEQMKLGVRTRVRSQRKSSMTL
mgnify:FL=1